jgi:hypothetical protein
MSENSAENMKLLHLLVMENLPRILQETKNTSVSSQISQEAKSSSRKKYVLMADNEMLRIGTQEGNDHTARHILHLQKCVLIEQILTRGVKFFCENIFSFPIILSAYLKRR